MTSLIVGLGIVLLVISNIATLVMLYNAYDERKSLMEHVRLLEVIKDQDDDSMKLLQAYIRDCRNYLNAANEEIDGRLFVSSNRDKVEL